MWLGGSVPPCPMVLPIFLSRTSAPFEFNYDVEAHAILDDGHRIVLRNDLGWGSSGPADSMDDLEQTVLNVVLPHDAEETGEDHPWEMLCQLLADAGVTAVPDEMRRVPYEVELTEAAVATIESPIQ